MTILFCQPTLDYTGSERSLLDVVAGLREATPHRLLLLAGADGPLRAEFAKAVTTVTVVDAPKLSRTWRVLPRYLRSYVTVTRAMRALCRTHGVSLVYVNTSMFPQAVVAAALCRVPSVVHVREVADTYPRGYYRAMTGLAARAARRIVCPSAFVREQARTGARTRFLARSFVVPNASPFDPGPVTHILSAPFRILSVIPVTERKGIVDLVACAEHLAATPGMPAFHVDVVGRIEDAALHTRVLARLRASGLEPAFRFHGAVRDVTPFYRDAHLLVHPSRHESFGRTAVEAASFSLPAIVVRTGGTPETIDAGHSGLLVEPGDAAAMARHAGDILLDPARHASMSAAAYRHYRARFTRDAMIAALRDGLRELGV